jgi:filamentous hemagglutinin
VGIDRVCGWEPGACRLINAHRAVVEARKFTEYALNPHNLDGRHKARVFDAALGYNRSNYEELARQIQRGVMEHQARRTG